MNFDLSDTVDFFADAGGTVIYAYTRAQAIEDGVLVDVTPLLPESPFPVAVTAAAWALINEIPEQYQGIQDVKGRLWDAYFMGMFAKQRPPRTTVYDLIMHHGAEEMVTLKLDIGRGDDGQFVITILLPHED
jgi:hypothetical protein